MKAAPLLVAWHDEKSPIYSIHFQSHGRGRLATAGGDNNVRLWNIDTKADETNVTYLATLTKHQQAVNVVRWHPREELLASAGDDGNVLIWRQVDHRKGPKFGEEDADDQETWDLKIMCRSNARPDLGIYDLAWSPDGRFFVTGSTDNVARIFDAATGNVVRQIAEHNHYVQGVTWDPLNEYIATQSSDRSVHIYKLESSDGQSTLEQPALYSRMAKMDLPSRRISSNSPAPPDFGHRASLGSLDNHLHPSISPAPSIPGTPNSVPLPMNPPHSTHHRNSSRGHSSPPVHRSPSPAPSMPLPAVMPSASPSLAAGLGVKSYNIYANETLTSFFRRLTFSPDGSLLFTPAGQYKNVRHLGAESGKSVDQIINTVYIYSRGGLNKPPVAHLPGHKKPSIAVRCSPIRYNLRLAAPTKNITIDTSSTADDIAPLPGPMVTAKNVPTHTAMEPPPLTGFPSPAPSVSAPSPRPRDAEPKPAPEGPQPAFALPYRIVYAVATQDAVYVYDTQQQTPLCIVSNLHFATFTDLCWSNDGLTLLMSSSDGFCSALSFVPGELGSSYKGPPHTRSHRPSAMNIVGSNNSTAQASPTAESMPDGPRLPASLAFAPSPSPGSVVRPPSPMRSNSASSIATQSSFAHPGGIVVSNPTPSVTKLPGVAASGSSALPSPTPPLTPLHNSAGHSVSTSASFASSTGASSTFVPAKRDGETQAGKEEAADDVHDAKRRRIVPTLVSGDSSERSGTHRRK